jgi:uncharacterized circularly permuted ATP-grasp superfamily protein/uncharacterized alpha-E superfamily protein
LVNASVGESRASALRTPQDRIAAWTRNYRPLPGIPDEFIAPDGTRREHWTRFLETLTQLEQSEIERRFAAADRRIREMGMSYRVHGETHDRSWPLGRLPLLLPESDWTTIARGIEQRADLLDRVLADVYGPGRLVSEGVLPAAAVAGSRDFLLPMRGVSPPGGRWLNLYAADIARGPDGAWWVLGDRAQAPSGSGYLLENRLVVSQALPSVFESMNVERLAPFFRDFRAGLAKSAQRSEPRICILTAGPWSQTYFEQSYLARYLGFLLVEGSDLAVSDGRVFVRTVAGMKRADVLWRHVDSDWVDPIELNSASRLGVPGLIDAMRAEGVAVSNMPGAGILESRALLAFMPAIARHLLGEKLLIPNIATWWCGQDAERERVLASLDTMSIAGAFTEQLPGFAGRVSMAGADLSSEERAPLVQAIRDRGVDFVGQDVAKLSTTPLWQNGEIVPRPFVLRVYAAATPSGWRMLPGGFCRISDQVDAGALSMGTGVQTADAWVLADRPVQVTSLLPTSETVRIVRLLGNLPSRAADNLFWFGRYLEREEATLRLVRCLCRRAVDPDTPSNSARQSSERLKKLLVAWGAVSSRMASRAANEVSYAAIWDADNYGSARAIAGSARRAASIIRERLSQDTWRLVDRLDAAFDNMPKAAPTESEIVDFADDKLTAIAALSGLFAENFNRVAGWIFYDIGRRVERGINTCRFARQFADRQATANNLDVLLDLIDSQITYRSRYVSSIALAPVRDMVLLDPHNPRSVGFQVNAIDDHIAALPLLRQDGMIEEPRRLAMQLRTEITVADADRLDGQDILAMEQKLATLADAVADRYFLQGNKAARAERTTGLG